MKQAFTTIELIFVIVIIGILAAVAVPKLAATRDDASVVKIVQSGVQAVHNLGMSYTANADYSSYSIAKANAEAECFTFAAAEGNMTIHLKGNCISSQVRTAVATLATKNGLLSSAAGDKTFQFAGKKVKF